MQFIASRFLTRTGISLGKEEIKGKEEGEGKKGVDIKNKGRRWKKTSSHYHINVHVPTLDHIINTYHDIRLKVSSLIPNLIPPPRVS